MADKRNYSEEFAVTKVTAETTTKQAKKAVTRPTRTAPAVKTVVEKKKTPTPSRSLNDFSIDLSKSSRYRQIASNLATLSADKIKKADETDAGYKRANGWITGIATIFGALAGGGVGATAGAAVAGGINSLLNLTNNSDDMRTETTRFSNLFSDITGYLTGLTNRDTTIMNTMDQIYSSMDNLRGAYGSSFVDTMYNYYLAKSGMTKDAYSLLTGNFKTFEDIGSGDVSGENGLFDTLTDGNQNLFNNVYAQLQLGDITENKTLLDSMVQSLYGANTEMGLQLREYENELRNALQGSSLQQEQIVSQMRNELLSGNLGGRSESISFAEQLGSAQAESATSGLRGGTVGSNADLVRLSRDLSQIQRTASTAALIGSLKYNIRNAQLNASATAYSYRSAQRRAVTSAINGAAISFNSIGRDIRSAERTSNYYLEESKEYERQFKEDFNDVAEQDKDKIFAITQR